MRVAYERAPVPVTDAGERTGTSVEDGCDRAVIDELLPIWKA